MVKTMTAELVSSGHEVGQNGQQGERGEETCHDHPVVRDEAQRGHLGRLGPERFQVPRTVSSAPANAAGRQSWA